jgi:hypothetical protein
MVNESTRSATMTSEQIAAAELMGQALFDWQNHILDNEHSNHLTDRELMSIKELRRKLMHRSVNEIDGLIFEWVKTGAITKREHTLLCKYHFTKYRA